MDFAKSKYPTELLQSSNGLLLFTLLVERGPQMDPFYYCVERNEDCLYVVNPVTNDWLALPKTRYVINFRTRIAFTTKLDPATGLVDKFMAVMYEGGFGGGVECFGGYGANDPTLLCFSSDVGQWVKKEVDFILANQSWELDSSFEFEERLFWVDVSKGLITWDAPGNDPFVVVNSKEAAVCRFIPVPIGREKPFHKSIGNERCIGSGGGFINFMEVFKKGEYVFELWRLNDCESGEWSFMYKVSRDHVERNLPCEFQKRMPVPCFVHPFEADVAYFKTRNYIFSLNVRTDATYAKELGNECFKRRNFTEAIRYYSTSINLSPNAAAFANRAMSYLKVNKFHEAENDCTESLKLDANYFKVYWRRAQARKELGYLEGALEDAEFGLKLEPENEQVKKLCAELKSMLAKESCERSELGEKDEARDKDVEGQ